MSDTFVVSAGKRKQEVSIPDGFSSSGLATEATLLLIKAKTDNIPPLGQALAAASVPVVLTAAQLSTLTPLSTVTANQGTANSVANSWPITITDATNTAIVQKASDWGGEESLNPSIYGLTVNSRVHQLWPTTGLRTGIAGDGTYYGQLMNDLGDLVVSLGSITSASGSIQIATGNGTASTGTLRVAIASNNTPFPVNATLSAETTKVIGTVNQGTNPWVIGDGSSSITVDAPVGTPVFTTPTPSSTGGWTPYTNAALSSTKTQITASACTVGSISVHNPAAATTYLQVWDLASASVTVGTTAATEYYGIPAGASSNITIPDGGFHHGTGLTIAATTTATGSGAPATALVITIGYK